MGKNWMCFIYQTPAFCMHTFESISNLSSPTFIRPPLTKANHHVKCKQIFCSLYNQVIQSKYAVLCLEPFLISSYFVSNDHFQMNVFIFFYLFLLLLLFSFVCIPISLVECEKSQWWYSLIDIKQWLIPKELLAENLSQHWMQCDLKKISRHWTVSESHHLEIGLFLTRDVRDTSGFSIDPPTEASSEMVWRVAVKKPFLMNGKRVKRPRYYKFNKNWTENQGETSLMQWRIEIWHFCFKLSSTSTDEVRHVQ